MIPVKIIPKSVQSFNEFKNSIVEVIKKPSEFTGGFFIYILTGALLNRIAIRIQ